MFLLQKLFVLFFQPFIIFYCLKPLPKDAEIEYGIFKATKLNLRNVLFHLLSHNIFDCRFLSTSELLIHWHGQSIERCPASLVNLLLLLRKRRGKSGWVSIFNYLIWLGKFGLQRSILRWSVVWKVRKGLKLLTWRIILACKLEWIDN